MSTPPPNLLHNLKELTKKPQKPNDPNLQAQSPDNQTNIQKYFLPTGYEQVCDLAEEEYTKQYGTTPKLGKNKEPLRSQGKISQQHILLVQNLIEKCLKLYMNKAEVVTALQQADIEPGLSSIIWDKLIDYNELFFKAYNMQMRIKEQITAFNYLVSQQAQVMQANGIGYFSKSGTGHNPFAPPTTSFPGGVNPFANTRKPMPPLAPNAIPPSPAQIHAQTNLPVQPAIELPDDDDEDEDDEDGKPKKARKTNNKGTPRKSKSRAKDGASKSKSTSKPRKGKNAPETPTTTTPMSTPITTPLAFTALAPTIRSIPLVIPTNTTSGPSVYTLTGHKPVTETQAESHGNEIDTNSFFDEQ